MPSLLDLMSEEERNKALERARRRMERAKSRKGHDVSPEIYLVAKAGSYWGWEAMMAIRRGYTIEAKIDDRGNLVTDKSGNIVYKKSTLTLDEVTLLLDGADKVRYAQLTEQIHAGVVSNSFTSSSKSFDNAINPFTEKAEVNT